MIFRISTWIVIRSRYDVTVFDATTLKINNKYNNSHVLCSSSSISWAVLSQYGQSHDKGKLNWKVRTQSLRSNSRNANDSGVTKAIVTALIPSITHLKTLFRRFLGVVRFYFWHISSVDWFVHNHGFGFLCFRIYLTRKTQGQSVLRVSLICYWLALRYQMETILRKYC